jgi:hypothetical protein
VGEAQPAARQAPASAEVTARRLSLATIVLGALVVLVGLSVPIGIAARQRFDGVVLLVVLTAALGWLITQRQSGNRIGLLLATPPCSSSTKTPRTTRSWTTTSTTGHCRLVSRPC